MDPVRSWRVPARCVQSWLSPHLWNKMRLMKLEVLVRKLPRIQFGELHLTS